MRSEGFGVQYGQKKMAQRPSQSKRLWRHCDACGKKDEMRPPGEGVTGGLCFTCATKKRKQVADVDVAMRKQAQMTCQTILRYGIGPEYAEAFSAWVRLHDEAKTLRGG